MAKDIILAAGFVASGVGATGLTVTVDVWRVTLSNLSASEIVTAGSATEIGDGLYAYRVASADLVTYYYYAVFKTTGTADVKHLFGAQLDFSGNTGDTFARIGAPAGASVSADIDALPTAAEITTAVWAAGTRTLTSFGTLVADIWSYATRTITGGDSSAADIWAYATRTLTQSAASVISAVSGSEITAYRGTTWSIALTGLGNITGYTNLWFAIKQSSIYNTDNESIVLIGVNSGLTRINGAAYATTSDGSITINDATAGDITITLKPAASSLLKVQSDLDYGIKWINASGSEYQLSDGTQKFNIAADNPRAIS